MSDATYMGQTVTNTSPFPTDTTSWIVRSIRLGWNDTGACEQWELLPQSSAMQIKDKRKVLPGNTLLALIMQADPRVASLKRGQCRDLLPSFKVKAKQRGLYCYEESFAVLPIQKAEQMRIDARVHFDALEDLRVELGLGRAEADNVVRRFIGQDDWYTLAADALRTKRQQPVDDKVYEAGFMPDVAAATATMVAHEAANAPDDTNELDGWLGKKEDRDVITEEMIDQHELDLNKILFALPAHLAKTFGNEAGKHVRTIYNGSLDVWLPAHGNDTRLAWRLALAYELKNAPIPVSENEVSENAPESANLEASAIPVPTAQNESASTPVLRLENSNQKGIVDMPESPIVVYPMQNGSIIYKGIRFSVTLRLGGKFDMAIPLMDDFVAHSEFIDPSCKATVSVPSMWQPTAQPATVVTTNTAPALPTLPPQNAAPTAGTADGKGRTPGQTGLTTVTGVELTKKNGKVTIELWGAGKFAEHYLKLDTEHAMLTALGYNTAQMEIGTRYGVNWLADWVVSANRANDGKGNYYLNVTGIRAIAQQAA